MMNGECYIQTLGQNQNLYRPSSLNALSYFPVVGTFTPSTKYSAQEFLFIRTPLRNNFMSFMDFICPIANLRENSIPGVATFMTYIPYPIPETFVERSSGFLKYKLMPHSLAVDKNIPPKQITKESLIKSKAVLPLTRMKKYVSICMETHTVMFTIQNLEAARTAFHLTGINMCPAHFRLFHSTDTRLLSLKIPEKVP